MLQQYKIELHFRHGAKNGNTDALSRIPNELTNMIRIEDLNLFKYWNTTTEHTNMLIVPEPKQININRESIKQLQDEEFKDYKEIKNKLEIKNELWNKFNKYQQ